jgi:Fuc2NAc and GlcNAc transferase
MAMFLAPLVATILTGGVTPLLAAWAHRHDYLDVPNHRSSHVVATPRIGGVAVVIGMLGGMLVLQLAGAGVSREVMAVMAGALAIALVGLVDDLRQLPAVVRLAAQVLVSAGVVLAVGALPTPSPLAAGWVAAVLTVIWIVSLTNAFNFMDGIDGLAGTQALVAGGGWAAIGLWTDAPDVTALGLLLAATSGGFLLHNWHPASVFMGDAGSGFYGFLFAALPLVAPSDRGSVWLCAVLLMCPFLLDTGFTLLRRASRGENLLLPHRSHVYQRLVVTGRSHSQVTLAYAGLALLAVLAAMAVVTGHPMVAVVLALTLLAAAGAVWKYLVSREWASNGAPGRAAT